MTEHTAATSPGTPFQGHMGKTLAESTPHWITPPRAVPGSPNVIVILMDDMGYSDLGCFGGEIDTPISISSARSSGRS